MQDSYQQPTFDGVSSGGIGMMHEQTFNTALGDALRSMRQAWREDTDTVLVERLQALTGQAGRRPDILVIPPDSFPIAVEVEFGDPAYGDARQRLGNRVRGETMPIRSAIAVGVSTEARYWSDLELRNRLSTPGAVDMRYILLSADIDGKERQVSIRESDIYRWPDNHYVTGGVEDLADLCENAASSPTLVARTADEVAEHIRGLADSLLKEIDVETAAEIANKLGQSSPKQGIRLACCIWLTSLRLHNMLATRSPMILERKIPTLAELREKSGGDIILLSELRNAWREILEVNYESIFRPALEALHPRIPELNGAEILSSLSILAERVASLRLGNNVDFAGELFPKLLDDRKETAAHYTLPETAELLARVAVERMNVSDWSATDQVKNLRIADLACGTGALLRAAYSRIRKKHDAAGGDAESLHKSMMEKCITGLDINALASHMTAAGLSSAQIKTEYRTTNIAAVAVSGGRTGSLELIESEQIADVTGEQIRTTTTDQAEPTNVEVPDSSQDLVIQNPPYSRSRAGRALFNVAGLDVSQRDSSQRRLSSITARMNRGGNRFANGKAGLGSHFSALADIKLKENGVFATVLPLTAAHAESWKGFRKEVVSRYRDVTVISFPSDAGSMLSADTHMNEMLLIARKNRTKIQNGGGV